MLVRNWNSSGRTANPTRVVITFRDRQFFYVETRNWLRAQVAVRLSPIRSPMETIWFQYDPNSGGRRREVAVLLHPPEEGGMGLRYWFVS
jgi:hypothetical protein